MKLSPSSQKDFQLYATLLLKNIVTFIIFSAFWVTVSFLFWLTMIKQKIQQNCSSNENFYSHKLPAIFWKNVRRIKTSSPRAKFVSWEIKKNVYWNFYTWMAWNFLYDQWAWNVLTYDHSAWFPLAHPLNDLYVMSSFQSEKLKQYRRQNCWLLRIFGGGNIASSTWVLP